MASRLFCVLAAALLLPGCATRGSLDIDCAGFTDTQFGDGPFRRALPLSALENQIRGKDGGAPFVDDRLLDNVRRSLDAARAGEMQPYAIPVDPAASGGQGAVLLLSGGGQWGAFGAGYLATLAGRAQLPNIAIITGVSTGGLQAMFVGAATPKRWEMLEKAYLPLREGDVVDRNPRALAVVTGSFAGLKPLERRITDALCTPEPGDPEPCPLIAALARSNIRMLVGFIEARTGDFFYADIGEIARAAPRDVARQCIAGVTLASAAMPVFFQQVRINKKAYYDGGVRQSVFANFADQLVRRASAGMAPSGRPDDIPFFVIRNGPTSLDEDSHSDGNADALTAAMRAESIVVNQLEVGSIAALRLQKPRGRIGFVSADGWESQPGPAAARATCGAIKNRDSAMIFSPAFMQCLMDYGQRRARIDPVWKDLMEIGPASGSLLLEPPVPANDN